MSDRRFFDAASIASCKTLIPEHLVIEGGSVTAKGGLKIDGALRGCTITCENDSMLYISPTAQVFECDITAGNVLVDGRFKGQIKTFGSTEFGPGALAIGVCFKSGEIYVHPDADVDDLIFKRLSPRVVESTLTPANSTTVEPKPANTAPSAYLSNALANEISPVSEPAAAGKQIEGDKPSGGDKEAVDLKPALAKKAKPDDKVGPSPVKSVSRAACTPHRL